MMSLVWVLAASVVVGVAVVAVVFVINAEMFDGRTEVSWCL